MNIAKSIGTNITDLGNDWLKKHKLEQNEPRPKTVIVLVLTTLACPVFATNNLIATNANAFNIFYLICIINQSKDEILIMRKSFFGVFPELQGSEFRNYKVLDSKDTPIEEGDYLFDEIFCTKTGCDCRNVGIEVKNNNLEVFATISYGWEKPSHYMKWSDAITPEMAEVMASASLCTIGDQSFLSGHFLKVFKDMIKSDKEYRDRIKRHYFMFKERECGDILGQNRFFSNQVSIGRNDQCTCGSGKKYKKCCMLKS